MEEPAFDKNRPVKLSSIDRLLTMMDELRINCPWDKEQTLESIRRLTIEEVFELSDAIISGDDSEIEKELGDILLHLVFYARIGEEKGKFDISTIAERLMEKLVRRHPHVYGDTTVANQEDVKRNWESIKKTEGSTKKMVMSGVPKSVPPLTKAIRIQEKARGAGFDWDNADQVYDKVLEEFNELKAEIDKSKGEPNPKINDEFGDLLFSMVNYARFLNIDPEEALERTNRKFLHRFNYLEEKAEQLGKTLTEMTLPEMEAIWQEAKRH